MSVLIELRTPSYPSPLFRPDNRLIFIVEERPDAVGMDPKAHRDALERLKTFTLSRSFTKIKNCLEDLPPTSKGPVFEEYLKLLYQGNGWLVKVSGGRGDVGADLLLYHPRTPDKVAFVVQAKNWSAPLTFDDAGVELRKFEEKGREEYDCSFYQLVALNGYVKEAKKLSRFNMILHGWDYIKGLIGSYDPDGIPEPRIDLYPHNQRSYEKVKRLFKKEDRVCVIQATGTGKSYLIGKLIADNIEKKSIILAPSHYILKQIERDFHYVLTNNVRMTYAKLSRFQEDEFGKYDLIILDEYHRPGAKEWGRGVAALLETNPVAKVFGTTATPIRYLDDGRDMSEELFAGNVANEIGLPAAIARRILKAPIYVSALYTLDEEIGRLKDKIVDSKRTDDEKESLLDEIKAAQIDWEKAKGIPKILRKHLKADTNKIIVFCRDRYHLDEMELEVQKWFLKAFRERKRETYRVLSSENERDKELKRFKDAKGTNVIHLLFCIDMLNEGLHVPDVGAVILLRPTVSPRVFYQQIGRCIQAGSGHTPIILDLVNNFRSIRASDFTADLESEIEKENMQRDKFRLQPSFLEIEIRDEIKETVSLFEEIEAKIQPWNVNYDHLISFRKENPNRWPSTFEEFPTGNMLGIWCNNQRMEYKTKKLKEARIKRLNRIGFVWNLIEQEWERQYDCLLEFRKKHPRRWPSSREEFPKGNLLGYWCGHQRKDYKSKTISSKRLEKMNAIGFVWDQIEEDFFTQLEYLKKFRELYPHRWPAAKKEFPDGNKLGLWCSNIRKQHKDKRLSRMRIDILDKIGFIWDQLEFDWWMQFEHLKKFKLSNPDRWPTAIEEYPVGNRLGAWLHSQRSYFKKGKLRDDRKKALEDIEFVWDEKRQIWLQQYSNLVKYRESYPDRWPEWKDQFPEGNNIGNWCHRQRNSYRKGALPQEYASLLDKIGFVWSTTDRSWKIQFENLKQYRIVNPNKWPSKGEEFPPGNKINSWVQNQRTFYRRGTLSKERIQLLEGIDFLWELRDDKWFEQLHLLHQYRKENPDRWPADNEDFPEGNLLGSWCRNQRTRYQQKHLSCERIALLEKIKFPWSIKKDRWNNQFQLLLEYRKLRPNEWPSVSEEFPEGNKLGVWCSYQRKAYKAGRLSDRKRERLRDIGFSFNPLEESWNRQFQFLIDFRKEHPYQWPSEQEEYPSGNRIGQWTVLQRMRYRKGKVSKDRIELLESIEFPWNPLDAAWLSQYEHLKAFSKENPNRWPVDKQEFPKGNRLGNWCTRQRKYYRSGTLSKERVDLLKSIGLL